jgi:hypothetical protein
VVKSKIWFQGTLCAYICFQTAYCIVHLKTREIKDSVLDFVNSVDYSDNAGIPQIIHIQAVELSLTDQQNSYERMIMFWSERSCSGQNDHVLVRMIMFWSK